MEDKLSPIEVRLTALEALIAGALFSLSGRTLEGLTAERDKIIDRFNKSRPPEGSNQAAVRDQIDLLFEVARGSAESR